MKKLICLISFIIIWTNSEAQQIGPYYNVTLSKVDFPFPTDFYRAKSIGMEYHFRTDKLVNFSLNGAYEEKGYDITTSLGNLIRVRFEYYTLKGLARIGNNNFDAQIGIYGGYLHYVEEWYNTTWNTDEDYYGKIDAGFQHHNPAASIAELMKVYKMIQNIENEHWKEIKSKEIKGIIEGCLGLYFEAIAEDYSAAIGTSIGRFMPFSTLVRCKNACVTTWGSAISCGDVNTPFGVIATALSADKGTAPARLRPIGKSQRDVTPAIMSSKNG